MPRNKDNSMGITFSKKTETVIAIKKENVEILASAFDTWLKADENTPKAAVCFANDSGSAYTFVFDESEDDEDGE